MTLRYSLITSTDRDRLTKRFDLAGPNELRKSPAGNMAEGYVQHASARDLPELAQRLDALAPNQAVAWGLSARASVPLVTKNNLKANPGALARCREHFAFANGPGVMMFDHDEARPGTPRLSAEALLGLLFVACPALVDAPMLVRPSASAGVAGPAGVINHLTRWRLYIPVSNAAEIPDAGERLMTLLWAAGLAWHWLDDAGRVRKRAILDGSVWLPERFDFCAAPVLGPGLVRVDCPAQLRKVDAPLFDLARIVVDDTTNSLAAANRAHDRAQLEPERLVRRAQYVTTEAPRLAEQNGISLAQAAATLDASVDEVLVGQFPLRLQDGREVTVEDLLTHVDAFEGVEMHDPLEPGYGGNDNRIAVAFLSKGLPIIYSHAHGGCSYRLLRDPTKVGFGTGPVPPGMLREKPQTAPAADCPPRALATAATAGSMAFLATAQGAIPGTIENVVDALNSAESGLRLGHDAFQDQIMCDDGTGHWRRFTDADYGRLRAAFGRRGFRPITAEIARSAVLMAAEGNRFDSAIDWARSLCWDGLPRVESALSMYFGAADTPYTRAVGRYLFTALAGRALAPGCQADMALVLVGLQGARKTSAVRALCPDPDFFVEINLKRIEEDNLARSLRGKLVGELAELRGLVGRDQDSVKAWVTRRIERWRPLYREFDVSFPRRLVLIGTTNEPEFLDDVTGERRWLPVDAGNVDVEAIERDRDQLWAEGVALFDASGVAWQDAERLAGAEHAKFKVADPWADLLSEWLSKPALKGGPASPDGPFKLADACMGALGRSVAAMNRADERRLGRTLRSLGFHKTDGRIEGGRVGKVWLRPGD